MDTVVTEYCHLSNQILELNVLKHRLIYFVFVGPHLFL